MWMSDILISIESSGRGRDQNITSTLLICIIKINFMAAKKKAVKKVAKKAVKKAVKKAAPKKKAAKKTAKRA